MAKPPYLLWLALIAFVVGCIALVRLQPAPAPHPGDVAFSDCWFRANGVKLFRGEQRCYRTLPQRRICGVWMPGFEQSLFLHDIADLSSVRDVRYEDLPWLDIADRASGLPTTNDGVTRRAAYRLCFVGRESYYYGTYGHMGMSRTGVLLEKVETIGEIPIPVGLKFVAPGVTN